MSEPEMTALEFWLYARKKQQFGVASDAFRIETRKRREEGTSLVLMKTGQNLSLHTNATI